MKNVPGAAPAICEALAVDVCLLEKQTPKSKQQGRGIMRLNKFLFLVSCVAAGSAQALPTEVLGTPPDGSTVSGISVISGYHCTSKDIEVFIDGVSKGKAGAGNRLLGTQDVCGHTETGYSLLFNFGNLADGQHTISVTADGATAPFATNTITTVKSGGVAWLAGASKETKVPDFPNSGQVATLRWVQSYQNFLVTGIEGTENDLSSLNGSYVQTVSISVSGPSCYYYNFLTGLQELVITAGTSATRPNATVVYVLPATFTDLCAFGLTADSGNSRTGYNLSGTAGCAASSTTSSVVATGFKKSEDGARLLGTVTTYFPGCTHTTVLY